MAMCFLCRSNPFCAILKSLSYEQTTDLTNLTDHAALSAYIAAALRRPLPPAVVEKTKHHVLDTIAAIVSGSRLAPGKEGDRLREDARRATKKPA